MSARKIESQSIEVKEIIMSPPGFYLGSRRVVSFARVEKITRYAPEMSDNGLRVQHCKIDLYLEPMICVGKVVARASSIAADQIDLTGTTLEWR